MLIVWWPLRAAAGDDRRFLWAAVRGTVQLSIIGYVLVPLFELENPAWVLAVMSGTCCLAAFFSLGVLGKGPGIGLWGLAVAAILPVVILLALVGSWARELIVVEGAKIASFLEYLG